MGIIGKTRPRYVVLENVQKQTINSCSEQLNRDFGYSSFAVCISAAQVGADHKRNRWWLIAHPYDKSELHGSVNAETSMLPGLQDYTWGEENFSRAIRVPDGLPNRMDRLKCLGNTIVPKAAEVIFREVYKVEYGIPY
jgi:DNA modification methylase